MESISGVFPVLPSIFDEDGKVDEDGMQNVLNYILDCGADGIVFPGLASEYEQLTADERNHLVSKVGSWMNGRGLFIIGAGADTLEKSILYAKSGKAAGATASMIMTPRQLDGNIEAMIKHFRAIYAETGLPIMLQNAPRPMGVGLSVEETAQIAASVDGLDYVKEETAPCGPRISALLKSSSKHLKGVLGGAGGRQLIDEMNRGSLGTIPACEITELHVALIAAHRAGDTNLARTLFKQSLPLLMMQAVFRWRLTKEVLKRRGLIKSAFTRAPGPEFDDVDMIELTALIDELSSDSGIAFDTKLTK